MTDTPPLAPVDALKLAMRHMASTVSVIATGTEPSARAAMTATSVTCVAMDPPSMLVCVNRKTAFHPVISAAEEFSINVLAVGQQQLASACGGAIPAAERFQNSEWAATATGTPVVRDAVSNIVCRKTASWDYGTHTIVVGDVIEVRHGSCPTPLVYQAGAYRQLHEAPVSV